jgi:hypothetical protein
MTPRELHIVTNFFAPILCQPLEKLHTLTEHRTSQAHKLLVFPYPFLAFVEFLNVYDVHGPFT